MQNDIIDALHAELDAALEIGAPMIWRQAPETCFHDAGSGYTCRPYHRVWQYLGLLGVATSMRTDSAFMIDALRDLAQRGGRRILISGTADFTMLAHVLYAFRLENVNAQVTVTDRCETPLAANRWYAARQGTTVTTVRSDILDFNAGDGFDAICTHSFIAWFTPSMQARLVGKWRDLLKPGGRLITTKRLRSGSPEIAQRNTEADAVGLRDRVLAAARLHADRHDLDPDDLACAAYAFSKEHYRYPTTSMAALRALFESAGLRITCLDDGASVDPARDRATGPVAGRGRRVRVIAQRDA
jgi:SAM-dependent methyltransferase